MGPDWHVDELDDCLVIPFVVAVAALGTLGAEGGDTVVGVAC